MAASSPDTPHPAVRSARSLHALAVAGALFLVTLAVFWRGLCAPFIFDDMASIVDNPAIRRLWPPDWLLASPPEANAWRADHS